MARDESVALGGYYPTPPALLPSIGALVAFEDARYYDGGAAVRHVLFDPCAGDGAAILGLRDIWYPKAGPAPRARVAACEMELRRHRLLLKSAVNDLDTALQSDAFALTSAGRGCSLLYLNPPYDSDPEHGRLEVRFLRRFAPWIGPDGALLYVVPVATLRASADTLAAHFSQIRCWRFPEEHFAAYQQVVLLGRKMAQESGDPGPAAAMVRSWADYPARIPSLERGGPALRIPRGEYSLAIQAGRFDRIAALAAFRPGEGLPVGVELGIDDLIGRQFPTALPPKPAHLALALAGGFLNGHRITADRPDAGHPPLLLKGMVTKELHETERQEDEHGDVSRIVKIQVPRLIMRALRLDDFRFFEPGAGGEPTAATDIEHGNARDLLDRYGEALGRLMTQQFPALHDPANPEHQIRLPDLPRPPFTVQRHAIQAALKLLALRRNPKLTAEVGTGKCLGRDTPVLMFDGTVKKVQDVAAGDVLMGPASSPRRVLSTTASRGPLYKITPVKGDSFVCNDVHVLTLVDSCSGEVYDQPLDAFLAQPRRARRRANAKLFRAAIELRERPTLISPYIVGVWLGDGTRGVPSITAGEPEIADAVKAEAERLGMRFAVMPDPAHNTQRLSIVGPRHRGGPPNRFAAEMRRCVVDGEKTIPADYLLNSRGRRLELLAGIVDTDGHLSCGGYEVTTKSGRLRDDLLFLARSLGFAAYSREKIGSIDGVAVGMYHRVFISGDISVVPCRLAIRKASPRQQKKNVLRTGFTTEPIGEGEYFGFTLDGDGRFLLGDFTVTHNTSVSLYLWAACTPRYHAQTAAELERVGIPAGLLPRVQRALVMCPPHLLSTWEEEIKGTCTCEVPGAIVYGKCSRCHGAPGCAPWARVQIVETIADLHADADLFILSREKAKLGHGFAGVGRSWGKSPGRKRCPRCGGALSHGPEHNADERLRCTARVWIPANGWARLAEEMAAALVPLMPDNEVLLSLIRHHRTLRRLAERHRRGDAVPRLDGDRLQELLGLDSGGHFMTDPLQRSGRPSILAEIARTLATKASRDGVNPLDYSHCVGIATDLADALQLEAEVADALETIAAPHRSHLHTPFTWAEEGVKALRQRTAALDDNDRRELLRKALSRLSELGDWHTRPEWTLSRHRQGLRPRVDPQSEERPAAEMCGEWLYAAAPEPRRYPLARYITRQIPGRFDLVILDEAHEFNNLNTAQEKAAHRLAELGVPVIALSGSLMGGFASSLFANFWSLDRGDFRDQFGRDDRAEFARIYGFEKFIFTPAKGEKGGKKGKHTDREEEMSCRKGGEVPGVLPLFLLKHLLPTGVIMHKDELDAELPPVDEIQVPILAETATDLELLAEYERIRDALMEQIEADQFTELAGKLWGAMGELPSYLDCATDDQKPFVLAYPESCGGAMVAEGKMFPASYITPKERAGLAFVSAELAEGRLPLFFIRHVNAGLPERILRLLAEQGIKATYLKSSKVKPAARKAWIQEHVLDKGVQVLVVNPVSVQTGLNILVRFSSAWWHESTYSTYVHRQANGRVHRIGQTKPVRIRVPFYAGTAQQVAVGLVARKVTASEQVDGLGVQGALESSGAEGAEAAVEATMAMGKAIYQRLRAQAGAI